MPVDDGVLTGEDWGAVRSALEASEASASDRGHLLQVLAAIVVARRKGSNCRPDVDESVELQCEVFGEVVFITGSSSTSCTAVLMDRSRQHWPVSVSVTTAWGRVPVTGPASPVPSRS